MLSHTYYMTIPKQTRTKLTENWNCLSVPDSTYSYIIKKNYATKSPH